MIFNIVLDAVLRAVLTEVCGSQEDHHRVGWVAGERNILFYVYNRRIKFRDLYWLQDSLSVTVDMFRSVRMETNLDQMKAVVCTPGFI